jgi:hypothetical protein
VDTTVSSISGAAGRTVSVYNNAASGINKSTAATVSYLSGPQRWNNTAQAIMSSEGLLLRTAATETGGKITIQKPY